MSRVGVTPIAVPSGVTVSADGNTVVVKGPKGELKQEIARDLSLVAEDGSVRIERSNEHRNTRAKHGLARALVANMVDGVSKGHERELEVHGVGYRASVKGKALELVVGYSHNVTIDAPEGIEFAVQANDKIRMTQIWVRGVDKQRVGQVAADIRKVRSPDAYKGKGIRYKGERVTLKPGKKAAK